MNSERLKVVFLMDTKRPVWSSEDHYRSQCLACTRILLHLSKFPNREHPNDLKWNYKLFSSRTPVKFLRRVDAAQFHETHSELLSKFFSEFESSREAPDSSPLRERKDSWGRYVYGALVATIQDFAWDAPEIRTPVQPRLRQKRSKLKGRKAQNTRPSPVLPRKNIVFLFSEGPSAKSVLKGGSGGKRDVEALGTLVLPQPMLAKLQDKNISIYWVQSRVSEDVRTFESLSSALKLTGGGVVPISILLDPMCQFLSPDTVSAGQGQAGENTKMGEDVLTPSIEEQIERTDHKMESIATSVLPPSTLLNEFLTGQRHTDSSRSQDGMKSDKLFWLSAEDGKAVCILELAETLKPLQSTSVGGFSSPSPKTLQSSLLQPTNQQTRSGSQEWCEGSGDREGRRVVLILGVVRMSDVALQWMDYTSVHWSSSYWIPGELTVMKNPPKRPRSQCTPSPEPVPVGLNLHKSPQIHLFRSPVSHLRRHQSKRRQKFTRKRSISVPDLGRRRNRKGRFVCCVEDMLGCGMVRGASQRFSSASPVKGVASPVKGVASPVKGVASPVKGVVSPVKGVAALPHSSPLTHGRDTSEHVEISETEVCPDPCDYLRESSQYSHSRRYQNLCIWLASNRLSLLVKMLVPSRLALLQPASSLVSTLTCVRPAFEASVESLVEPLPQSLTHAGPCVVTEGAEVQEQPDPSGTSPQEGAVLPSPLELQANIHLLCRYQSKPVEPSLLSLSGSVRSTAPLVSRGAVQPFTYTPLMPWFPYAQSCGVKRSTVERIREMQQERAQRRREGLERRKQLISQLRDVYATSDRAPNVTRSEEGGVLEEKATADVGGSGEEVESSPVPVLSTEELFEQFKLAYEEHLSTFDIQMLSDADMEICALSDWISAAVPRLLQEVTTAEGSGDKFWSHFHSNLLLSEQQLGERHGGGARNLKRELNECLLQVLLHLESWKLCQVKTVTAKTLGNRLMMLFLRAKHSCCGEGGWLYTFFEKAVLPKYGSSCREVIDIVREFWLSEEEEDSNEDQPMEEGGVDSREESVEELREPLSLERPPAPRNPSAKRLVRHMSFQEVSTRRTIAMPSNRQRMKRKLMSASGAPLKATRSPRKLHGKTKSVVTARRKSVCRSLFSRSHTVSDIGEGKERASSGRKKGPEMSDPNILVKETPVKLQALKVKPHFVSSLSPGVKIIQESPRRSFYSSKVFKRHFPTPQFKTPPYRPKRPSLPLKKDPSPSTLLSLFQTFSPRKTSHTTPPTTTPTITATTPLTKAAALSPDLFDRTSTPADILSSKDLFPGSGELQMSPIRRTGSLGSGFKSARMLTYEREEPLVGTSEAVLPMPGIVSTSTTPEKLVTHSKPIRTVLKPTRTLDEDRTPVDTSELSIRTPPSSQPTKLRWSPLLKYTRSPAKSNGSPIRTPTKFIGTPTKLTTSYRSPETPVKSKRLSNRKHCSTLPHTSPTFDLGVFPSTSYTTPTKPLEEVALVTPPSHGSGQSREEGGLTGIDPVMMEDSASMVAFSLSTPTKETPRDFHHVFQHQSHDH